MAKAKVKAAPPVPQSDDEAEQLLARLGASQRDQAEATARHGAAVAALEEEHGKALKAWKDEQASMTAGLLGWATAHRARLTGGGRTKTVQLAAGKVLWRDGRYAVKHPGLKKNEDVVAAVLRRIDAVEEEIRQAKAERARAVQRTLEAALAVLRGFLRRKVEPDKEAMIANRAIAETVEGIRVPRGGEEFVVEPLASQISEVAAS